MNDRDQVIKQLLSQRNNAVEFFDLLHTMWLHEYRSSKKELTTIILKLNREHGIDFCHLASKAIIGGISCYDVLHVLEGSFHKLQIFDESFIQLAEVLYQGMKRDMMVAEQFKLARHLAIEQPKRAKRLLQRLLELEDEFIVGYISSIYQGLSIFDKKAVQHELEELSHRKSLLIIKAVIDALGNIEYNYEEDKELASRSIKIIGRLENLNNEELTRAILFAYDNLSLFHTKIGSKIEYYSISDNIQIQDAIATILYRNFDGYKDSDWFGTSLLNLTKLDPKYGHTIRTIDLTLSRLVQIKKEALAEDYMMKTALNWGDPENKTQPSDAFHFTFATFQNNRDFLQRLLAKLFNHHSVRAHFFASEVISYCNTHSFANLILDKKSLKNLKYPDLLHLSRKILAHIFLPDYQCSLCFSLLEAQPRNSKTKSLVYTVFSKIILENHQGTAHEFLKQKRQKTKSKNIILVLDQLISETEQQISFRKSLPYLNELTPSNKMMNKVLREFSKTMERGMNEHQSKSSIFSMARKVQLINGTGWFHYEDEDYSNTSKMGKVSSSFELPFSEVTNPVEAAIERFSFFFSPHPSNETNN